MRMNRGELTAQGDGVEPRTGLEVLIVDDEEEYALTLAERLSMRNIPAQAVFDGEAALDRVGRTEPGVILLDLMLPGMSGHEVLDRLRTDYPRIPVIMLTGHGSDRDREACLARGAFSFLSKPIDIEDLTGLLSRAHQGSRAGVEGSGPA